MVIGLIDIHSQGTHGEVIAGGQTALPDPIGLSFPHLVQILPCNTFSPFFSFSYCSFLSFALAASTTPDFPQLSIYPLWSLHLLCLAAHMTPLLSYSLFSPVVLLVEAMLGAILGC